MCIEDHINLFPDSLCAALTSMPWVFVFLTCEPYDVELSASFRSHAHLTFLCTPVCTGVPGPQLETRAEYRYLRAVGADAVGMSTVPEVIAAAHMNMPCAALSVITDECNPEHLAPFNIDEVLTIAKKSEPLLTQLFSEFMSRLWCNVGQFYCRAGKPHSKELVRFFIGGMFKIKSHGARNAVTD